MIPSTPGGSVRLSLKGPSSRTQPDITTVAISKYFMAFQNDLAEKNWPRFGRGQKYREAQNGLSMQKQNNY